MSIRPRQWTNKDGNLSTRWVLDYVDGRGKRRHLTFKKKREAKAARTRIETEKAGGVHTANRASITVPCEGKEPEGNEMTNELLDKHGRAFLECAQDDSAFAVAFALLCVADAITKHGLPTRKIKRTGDLMDKRNQRIWDLIEQAKQ
jgi:hypothetical protein